MKLKIFLISITALISCNNNEKTNNPFEKGDLVNSKNFIGEVWLNYLSETDSVHNVNIGSVTFSPGARTNWHYHKGGQILLITKGKGLYQERGQNARIVNSGDVIKCPPNIEHWHGATLSDTMSHIAIGTNTNIGGAIWLEPVSEVDYKQN